MTGDTAPSSRNSPKNQALKNVWILTCGSRGDAQPYIAMAAELIKRGISVQFYTNDDFLPLAKSVGVDGKGIGLHSSEEINTNSRLREAFGNGSMISIARETQKTMEKRIAAFTDFFTSEINHGHLPDLCIITPLMSFVGYHLALNYGVPFLAVNCQAIVYNPKSMIFGMPTLPFGLHYYIMRFVIGSFHDVNKIVDQHWDSNIFQRFGKQRYLDTIFDPDWPLIIFMTKEIANVAYYKPHPMLKFVGMPVIKKEKHENTAIADFGGEDVFNLLQNFISKGSKPVYLGWGSMFSKSTEYMTEWSVRALYHSGQRGIILGGWAKLSLDAILNREHLFDRELIEYAKENILFIPSAPHQWLFPQVSLAVHHGGAGTLNAVLRAGIPTIVTPVLVDQFDNSQLVNDLKVGYGFSQQMQKIPWRDLGNAIKKISSDDQMRERASLLGQKLRSNDGAECAADEVENYWKEFCLTGKFFEYFPGQVKRKSNTDKITIAALFGVVAIFMFLLLQSGYVK